MGKVSTSSCGTAKSHIRGLLSLTFIKFTSNFFLINFFTKPEPLEISGKFSREPNSLWMQFSGCVSPPPPQWEMQWDFGSSSVTCRANTADLALQAGFCHSWIEEGAGDYKGVIINHSLNLLVRQCDWNKMLKCLFSVFVIIYVFHTHIPWINPVKSHSGSSDGKQEQLAEEGAAPSLEYPHMLIRAGASWWDCLPCWPV